MASQCAYLAYASTKVSRMRHKPSSQELCAYQDALVPPGVTFAVARHFTRSSMRSSAHFTPKHVVTYALIHINARLHP